MFRTFRRSSRRYSASVLLIANGSKADQRRLTFMYNNKTPHSMLSAPRSSLPATRSSHRPASLGQRHSTSIDHRHRFDHVAHRIVYFSGEHHFPDQFQDVRRTIRVSPVVKIVLRQDRPGRSVRGDVHRTVILRPAVTVLNHDATFGAVRPLVLLVSRGRPSLSCSTSRP